MKEKKNIIFFFETTQFRASKRNNTGNKNVHDVNTTLPFMSTNKKNFFSFFSLLSTQPFPWLSFSNFFFLFFLILEKWARHA